jgi:ADP-L-glycero-D-manno-heptose 6-epimerase
MIVITGASGFIASCLVGYLNEQRFYDLVLVDDFSKLEKKVNLEGKKFSQKIERSTFISWLDEHHRGVEFIFHLGARTDTTEFNKAIFDELNLHYSQAVWNKCVEFGIPLVYASSAATYGLGELGYEDNHEIVEQLKPLNPYGDSKNDFDKWALKQERKPYFWAGLKFFNVYGPNESHKKRMASVIFHSYNQIVEKGSVNLFRSHRADYTDGGQMRDFVYVKDLVKVCYFLMQHRKDSGLYNLGTGKARSFYDLASATFEAMQKPADIRFIDTPADIRDTYQYFTEANMAKLRSIGYSEPFYSLEEGVKDYVQEYLMKAKFA